jgi:hypothetical protein
VNVRPAVIVARRTHRLLLPRFLAAALVSAGLVATGAGSSGCGRADVVVALHDEDALRDQAVWAELIVYPGGCRPPADIPPSDAAFRAVVPADAEFPRLGDLATAKYGFAAILRNADCRVVADGCTEANLERVAKINIFVSASSDAPPGCIGQCNEGSCPAGTGGGAGAGGSTNPGPPTPTECLALRGEFPLPVAASTTSTITPPTILTTSTGFAIAYRDRAGTGGKDLVTVVPIGLDGQIAGSVQQQELSSCPGGSARNDVGLGGAVDATAGLLFADRPACTGDADQKDFLALMSLSPAGPLSSLGETRGDGARKVVTSGSSVIALGQNGKFGVLFRVSAADDVSEAPPLSTKLLVASPAGNSFAFGSGLTSVAGGASSRFALGALWGKSELRVYSGLADKSLRLDSFDVSGVDTLGSSAVPSTGTPQDFGPTDAADVARSDTAVALAQRFGKSVTLSTFPVTGTPTKVATTAATAPQSIAVAMSKTHSFIAQGTKGNLALSAFSLAKPTTEIPAPSFKLPSLARWSGDQLAMAAGHDGLLVAWTNHADGDAGAVGGYALFVCAEK